MKLAHELGLTKGGLMPAHEAVLSIFYTGAQIRKAATRFFRPHGLTDAQFNVLTLLESEGGREGLSQVELGRMMLVNRANITPLVDRLEREGLVRRVPYPDDRRYNRIVLSPKGRQLYHEVEGPYMAEVERLTAELSVDEQDTLTKLLERVRRAARKGE